MFLIIMGIIVTSDLELTNGITINDFYVNINHIEIVKSRIENIKYNIRAQRQIYLNKSKRDIIIESHPIIICTENLTDLEEQIYTKLKTEFTSYVDDL
jgi:hypothetical protein